MAMRVRMTVAYDGGPFHGFAINAGVPTVAGHLIQAVQRVNGAPVEVTCAGRTDRGVHARGQVVSFDADERRFDGESWERSLNRMLAPSIAVRDVKASEPGFDARFSARARRYRYLVRDHRVPDPFLAGWAWQIDQRLDLDALRLACDPFIGEHDFSAFCRRPRRADGEEVSLVRRVTGATWERRGNLLRFEVEAGAFCHQMVRSMVGTMVEVGRGKRRAGEVAAIIRGRDRAGAGDLAPPHGLVLWSVAYEGWRS